MEYNIYKCAKISLSIGSQKESDEHAAGLGIDKRYRMAIEWIAWI
jgi:hypothetical protein